MARFYTLLGMLILNLPLLAAAEPSLSGQAVVVSAGRVSDPGKLLPSEAGGAVSLAAKLLAAEKVARLTMIVEFHPQSPSAEEDKVPGAYMRALAAKLGTERAGVLAVYFADEDDWRVWIGDELTAQFVGRPGTAKEFTESGAMHDAKEVFLKTTFDAAEATFKARQAKAPLGEGDAKALRRALQAEALIDGLAGKLTQK